jgi:glyoxylate/hydroxypyruvate reductase A
MRMSFERRCQLPTTSGGVNLPSMRIHFHNPQTPSIFTVTQAQLAEAITRAGQNGRHACSFGNSARGLEAVLPELEVLISGPGSIEEVLPQLQPDRAPRLRLVFTVAAGIETLPPDGVPPVPFVNNRGAHSEKAAEFVAMALLMLTSGMPHFIADQQTKRWNPRFFRGLRGRRLLVLGLGAMGGASADQAAHFGMDVIGIRGTPAPHAACREVVGIEQLDALLPESEFLLLSCPLTTQTHGILDRRRIALLPKGGHVINIGRGALIDQAALCDALDDGHLESAMLDVFDPEPVAPQDRAWTTRNLVMTPHAAVDDAVSYIPRSLDVFFANLAALEAGQPLLTPVDFARGY